MPALRYTLDWLYQFLNFEQSDQFVVRQCASALVTLINVRTNCDKMFDKLSLCMSKWFSVAARVPVEGVSIFKCEQLNLFFLAHVFLFV